MTTGDHSKEFPDIDSKLSAPRTLSAYGKEKQAQEAKRQRAEIEDAEALRKFEEDFGGSEEDNNDSASGSRASYNGSLSGAWGYGGTPGRFGGQSSGPRSGPGSLGPSPGLPPPPSLKRKRAMEEARGAEAARWEEEWFTDDKTKPDGESREISEEPNDIAPKPTLQLSYLPPGTSQEAILDLLQPYVEVYSVEIVPASGVKRTDTAIATLENVTKQSAIDVAVSTLRDRYLGGGYFLSIARHLSSTALRPHVPLGTASTSDEPFGAKKPRTATGSVSLRNAPPPSHFAPPGSYEARYPSSLQVERTIPVTTSLDDASLRAIHIIADLILSEVDPGRALQIEGLLMNDPSILRDERFAFLYDSHSPAGVYYRYLIWSDYGRFHRSSDQSEVRIFDDVHYGWPSPHPSLPFVNVIRLGDVMEDSDYNSDEEESDDEDEERKFNSGARDGAPNGPTDEQNHLTPSQQARLAWLLSQVPTTHTMLRSIDVANVTNFAIAHASAGSETIVDILTFNVHTPFSSTSWAKGEEFDYASDGDASADQAIGFEDRSQADGPGSHAKRDTDDPSHAKLIGLYLISDIILNAVTAGAKGAWKYRQLFEAAFRAKKTFEYLGQLDKELSWGRLRAEQWKNKVTFLLDAWEKQSVFKDDIHKELRKSFLGQSGDERGDSTNSNNGDQTPKISSLPKAPVLSRFKKISGSTSSPGASGSGPSASSPSNLLGQRGDADHEMLDVREIESAPVDGLDDTPMKEVDSKSETVEKSTSTEQPQRDGQSGMDAQKDVNKGFSMSVKSVKSKQDAYDGKIIPADSKRRMRAEDMFADSDEE